MKTNETNHDSSLSSSSSSSAIHEEENEDDDESIDSLLREAGRIPKVASLPMNDEPDRIGQQLGRFRIDAELGKGGMGIVYRARDMELGRDVALKVLPRAAVADDERRRRFLREAKAAAAVSHPNLAAVYDVGEASDTVFLAMELVRGQTLRTKMEHGGGGLPIHEAIATGIQICRGVGKAHASGIVHRDLKPENVMIVVDDGVGSTGTAKVVDFGLAKLLVLSSNASASDASGDAAGDASKSAEMSTVDGKILGTPSYMAPEQAKASRVTPAADVFSLGVMLYEMSTGSRPFTGTALVDVLVSVAHDTPLAPSKKAPDARISRELDRIILRCLAKDPTMRYPDADALASALEAAPLHDARRRGRVTTASIAIGIVAIAAIFATLVMMSSAKEQKTPSSSVQAEPSTAPTPSTTMLGGVPVTLAVAPTTATSSSATSASSAFVAASSTTSIVGRPSSPPSRPPPTAHSGVPSTTPAAPHASINPLARQK